MRDKNKNKDKRKAKPKFREIPPPVADAAVEAAARRFAASLKPRSAAAIPPPKQNDPAIEEDFDAYSIREFCRRHFLSEMLFYKLQREGKGPKTFNVGRRKLIAKKSAKEWREKLIATQQAAE